MRSWLDASLALFFIALTADPIHYAAFLFFGGLSLLHDGHSIWAHALPRVARPHVPPRGTKYTPALWDLALISYSGLYVLLGGCNGDVYAAMW